MKTALIALLSLVSIFFGYKYFNLQKRLYSLEEGKVLQDSWNFNSSVYITRWVESENLNGKQFDLNYNGVFERVELYDQTGNLISVSLDENENGIYEHFKSFNPNGKISDEVFDLNEDSYPDSIVVYHQSQIRQDFLDKDFDKLWETVRLHDSAETKSMEYTRAEYLKRLLEPR